MQLSTDSVSPSPFATSSFASGETATGRESVYAQYKIIRRNGAVVGFEPAKISIAMTKAFIAVNGGQGAASARVREVVAALTESVVSALMRRQPNGGTFHIEDIQDQVELALMRSGEHDVARAYVLYREQRTQERARQQAGAARRRTASHQCHRKRPDPPARHGAPQRPAAIGLRRAGRCRCSAADPRTYPEESVRRRADRGSGQVGRSSPRAR